MSSSREDMASCSGIRIVVSDSPQKHLDQAQLAGQVVIRPRPVVQTDPGGIGHRDPAPVFEVVVEDPLIAQRDHVVRQAGNVGVHRRGIHIDHADHVLSRVDRVHLRHHDVAHDLRILLLLGAAGAGDERFQHALLLRVLAQPPLQFGERGLVAHAHGFLARERGDVLAPHAHVVRRDGIGQDAHALLPAHHEEHRVPDQRPFEALLVGLVGVRVVPLFLQAVDQRVDLEQFGGRSGLSEFDGEAGGLGGEQVGLHQFDVRLDLVHRDRRVRGGAELVVLFVARVAGDAGGARAEALICHVLVEVVPLQ
jgi:hypothetical protein